MPIKILHLTLHRKWFDAIASGEKTREYREIKPFWTKRLFENGERIRYDEIHFRNGYAKNAPWMRVEYQGMNINEWDGKDCYAIQLGAILEIKNWPAPHGAGMSPAPQSQPTTKGSANVHAHF